MLYKKGFFANIKISLVGGLNMFVLVWFFRVHISVQYMHLHMNNVAWNDNAKTLLISMIQAKSFLAITGRKICRTHQSQDQWWTFLNTRRTWKRMETLETYL